jgi:hypothetical protein
MKKFYCGLLVFIFIFFAACGDDTNNINNSANNSPETPTLVAPANDSLNTPLILMLDWNDANNTSVYTIQISVDMQFSGIIKDTTVSISSYTTFQGLLDTNKYYYWRVKASDQNGSSSWSNVWKFKTAGFIPAGIISFTQIKLLRTLTPANDGLYNLWVLVTNVSGVQRFLKLGKFNVLSNGSIVDENGLPMEFSMNLADTVDLIRAKYALITIEQANVVVPGPTKLIAGPMSVYSDSIYAQLLFTDSAAFGLTGTAILTSGPVNYHLNTPSNAGIDCIKGIWFAKLDGTSSWPIATLLIPGQGWKYRGWLRNRVTNEHYNLGFFYRADQVDSDGPGACAGSGIGYSTPGQDFIISGCSNITNISDGSYEVFAVLEPESRTNGLPPFVYKIFYNSIISPTLGCNRLDNMYTQSQNIPHVSVSITR